MDGLTAAYQRILAGLAVALVFWLGLKFRRSGLNGRTFISQFSLPPAGLRPWILANALAGPALGVGCYQWALMTEKSGVVLPIVALTPLVIIPFSRFVEGERPTRRSLMGGVIAVAGVFILADGMQLLKKLISSGSAFH